MFEQNNNNRFELSVIVLYYIGSLYSEYTILEYAILFKSLDFFSLFKKFCEMFDHNRNKLIYTQSAQIVLQIFILAHISACIFITVAKASSPAVTWISKLIEVTQIKDPSVSELYTSALYWSIITMVTLGYGDIVPISKNEKLFVIFIAFVSCGLFGYSFNLISEIINESKKNKNKLKNDLEMLNNLIEERGLNNELKSKVRRYFEYLYKEKQKNIEVGQEMIGALPPNLKDEVMNDLYSQLLKQHPLFSQNFTEQFLYDLSLAMKEFKVGPELLIIKKQLIQDKLYFVLKGEVRLYWQKLANTNTTIQSYSKGAILGLQEFITQTPVEYFYKSETVTSLGYIQYSEFLETLKKHPKDYEVYYKLKDKLNIYREGTGCRISCRFCKKAVHTGDLCPLITYQPNLNKLIYQQKKLELIKQERQTHERVLKSKQNSRVILANINVDAHKAANDLLNEEQQSMELSNNAVQLAKITKAASKYEQINQDDTAQEISNNTPNKDTRIEEQLQQIRQRRISYHQNIFRRATQDNKGRRGSNTLQITQPDQQPFSQPNLQNDIKSMNEELMEESSKTSNLNKIQSFVDQQIPVSVGDKQSQQAPSIVILQKHQNFLKSLEEIKEIVPNQSNQNELEGSVYYSYNGKNSTEKQNEFLEPPNDFEPFKAPTLIFIDPSSNNNNYSSNNFFSNNLNSNNNNNLATFSSQNKQTSFFGEENKFEQKPSLDIKIFPEENNLTKPERSAEKRKTFTNFVDEADIHQRIQKKKLSNIMSIGERQMTMIHHNDTPMSMKQQVRRRTSNNNTVLTNQYSQYHQSNQNQPVSPTNSQQQFQPIYFDDEFELPFIIIPSFDKLQNYTYYFPHNNPRTILRNIEDQRLQLLEKKRKSKLKKNQSEKSKFIQPTPASEKKI